MVQYIFTPWRDRHELLLVRRQFYPDEAQQTTTTAKTSPASGTTAARALSAATALSRPSSSLTAEEQKQRRLERQRAVARVSMWMQRGNCPHMVESTALLTAAALGDEDAAAVEDAAAAAAYAARAAYCAAFGRFVTGLLDGHQDKQRKLSMYSVAKTIGLPATFVELRHQATHEQLPSLARLRGAARKALGWIWEYYWRQLGDEEEEEEEEEEDGGRGSGGTADVARGGGGVGADGSSSSCRALLVQYLGLDGNEDEAKSQRDRLWKQIRKRWDDERILSRLAEIGESTMDTKLMLGSLRLSREIVGRQEEEKRQQEVSQELQDGGEESASDIDRIKAELEQSRQQLQALGGHDDDVDMQDGDEEHEGRGGGEEDIKVDGRDKAMADAKVVPALWTRYPAAWKPKPIGVV